MKDKSIDSQLNRGDEIDKLKKDLKSNIEWLILDNKLTDAKNAIADFEAIENSNDLDIYSMKSVIAIQEDDFEKASLLLLEAYTMNTDNFDILYNLAYVYKKTDDIQAFKRFLIKAFKVAKDEEHHKLLGEMMEGLEEEDSQEILSLSSIDTTNDVIFVLCPSEVATGGPELLHQLCYKLNFFGYEAYMCYYGNPENPVNERYKKYKNKYVTKIINTEKFIIIMPEIIAQNMLSLVAKKLIIWWLSVDNFWNSLKYTSLNENEFFVAIKGKDIHSRFIHFVQSQYANNYLLQNGIKENEIFYLSDYLNDEFIKKSCSEKKEQYRYPNILYNPNKGYEFTSKIIKATPELNWIPLINYSPEEMRILMNRSMVYIDFGNHPGKDRIPREAVICGLCILTGRRGAAANEVDIPVSEEYKILDRDENIQQIIYKIKEMIENYEIEVKNFNDYKNKIIQEENKFEEDIDIIFKRILI